MTRRVIPSGPAAEIDAATLYAGEVVFDTTNDKLRVGDGATAGGRELASVEDTITLQSSGSYEGFMQADDPLWIGSGTVNNSSLPLIVGSRNITGDAGNWHCFTDSSQLTFSNSFAYNSFDARVNILGAGAMDHYAAFQVGIAKSGSGSVNNIFSYYCDVNIQAGTINNYYGLFFQQPTVAGGATLGRVVGLLFNGIPESYAGGDGNPNYVILSNGAARAFLGGQLTAPKIYASGVGEGVAADLVHAASPAGTEAFIRVQQQGNNFARLGFDASSIDFSIYVLNTKRLEIQNAGHVLPGGNDTQDLGSSALSWRGVYADTGFYVGGTKVVGAQGAAVADPAAITYVAPSGGTTTDAEARTALAQLAADVASIRTALVAAQARLRAHGLIAS